MQITNKDYLLDRDILFQHYFLQENSKDSLNKNIQNIQLFLNTDFIKNSIEEQEEFVNSLLTFTAQHNLDSLAQYLLYSESLPAKANLKYSNYQALVTVSAYDSSETGLILINKFYEDFEKSLPQDKKSLPENIFKNLCFNKCNKIIEQILNYPKEFYKEHLNSAFEGACLGVNFEICEKILQQSIEIKEDKLFSSILDNYPYYMNMYSIIDFNKEMLVENDKIKIIDYLLNNQLLNPENYPNYIQSSNPETVEPEHLIYIAYSYGFTNIIDSLLEQKNIKNLILPFIDEDLIKRIIEKPPFVEENILINYSIMELGIARTLKLYNYLDNIIKNNPVERKRKTAQDIMDLYDIVEFNDKLEAKVEQKSIALNKKKKL